jgi:hypothetical protein
MPSRGHSDAHDQLDLTLGPLANTAAASFFSKARTATSIKNAGVVPADPITNFRPLFLLPLQQTMLALDQLHPRAVLSQ